MSVKTSLDPGAALLLQEYSPAQSNQDEITGARSSHYQRNRIREKGDPTTQLTISNEPGEPLLIRGIEFECQGSNDRQPGEQRGNSDEQKKPLNRGRKNRKAGEQYQHKRRSRSKKKMDEYPGQVISSPPVPPISRSLMNENANFTNSTQDIALPVDGPAGKPVSQWLKKLLPEASGGWWDVYPKDNGFAVKFRWRDQGRQTLSFPRFSHQELKELNKCPPDETKRILLERISGSLHSFLLNPARYDKALLVARKLGIDLENKYNSLISN